MAWLCGELELRPCLMVGHSMGGNVALEMAAHYPERVHSVVLINSVLFPPPELLEALAPLIQALEGPSFADAYRHGIEALCLPTDEALTKAHLISPLPQAPQHVLTSALRDQLFGHDIASAAAGCRCPVAYLGATALLADLARFSSLTPQIVIAKTLGRRPFLLRLRAGSGERHDRAIYCSLFRKELISMSQAQEAAFSAAAILAPGEGETLNVLGNRCVVKVGAAQTGGLLMTMESHVDPQAGPPPHVHHREDETFYILEGDFEFRLGDETIRAGAGAFVYAPRGQVHTFRNISPTQQGRLLVTTVPAGIEAFYQRLNALPPGPPDVARVRAIAQEYGITIMTPGERRRPLE